MTHPRISTPQLETDDAREDGIQEPAASTMGLSSGNQEEAKMASGLCPSDDRTPQDGATSPSMSPTKNTSLLPEPTFRQLRKLHRRLFGVDPRFIIALLGSRRRQHDSGAF